MIDKIEIEKSCYSCRSATDNKHCCMWPDHCLNSANTPVFSNWQPKKERVPGKAMNIGFALLIVLAISGIGWVIWLHIALYTLGKVSMDTKAGYNIAQSKSGVEEWKDIEIINN